MNEDGVISKLKQRFQTHTDVNAFVIQAEKQKLPTLLRQAAAVALCPEHGCFSCRICRKVMDKNHFDVYWLPNAQKEKNQDKLEVADIARLVDEAGKRPVEGDKKVFLVDATGSVDGQNAQTWQNKLLKTLEEPAEGVYIFIGVENVSSLLPTVRSRCQTLYEEKSDGIEAFVQSKGLTQKLQEETLLLADGSLPRAEEIVSNSLWFDAFDDCFLLLCATTSTKNSLPFVYALTNKKENFAVYLEIMRQIVHQTVVFRLNSQLFALSSRQKEIEKLCSLYSIEAALSVEQLIDEARRRLDEWPPYTTATVADNLIADILEVKYRCRI